MRLAHLAIAAAACAGLAAPALAKPPEGRFIHPADTNQDERITKAEWTSSGESPAGFKAADADRDGAVDGPEFAAWFMAKEGITPLQASARQSAGPVNRFVER